MASILEKQRRTLFHIIVVFAYGQFFFKSNSPLPTKKLYEFLNLVTWISMVQQGGIVIYVYLSIEVYATHEVFYWILTRRVAKVIIGSIAK